MNTAYELYNDLLAAANNQSASVERIGTHRVLVHIGQELTLTYIRTDDSWKLDRNSELVRFIANAPASDEDLFTYIRDAHADLIRELDAQSKSNVKAKSLIDRVTVMCVKIGYTSGAKFPNFPEEHI